MKVKDAAAHFGSKAALARNLGLERSTVTKWGDIVPLKWAMLVRCCTKKRVALRLSDYTVTQ